MPFSADVDLREFTDKGVSVDALGRLANRYVAEGMKHAIPSPETAARLKELEEWRKESERLHVEQRVFMEKFEGVPKAIETLNATMQQIVLQLEGLKPVKLLVYGFVGMAMTAVVGALIALVVVH